MSMLHFFGAQKQTSSVLESVNLSTFAHKNGMPVKAIWNTGIFAALWYRYQERWGKLIVSSTLKAAEWCHDKLFLVKQSHVIKIN